MFVVSETTPSSPGVAVTKTLALSATPTANVTVATTTAVPIGPVAISAIGAPTGGEVQITGVPMPRPDGGVGAVSPGSPGRLHIVAGGEGDDVLVIQSGGIAFGGGGDDTFVLTSRGGVEGSEMLGMINDFNEGDSLDLSQLGAKAQILGREQPAGLWGGPDRISVDYDGDGLEDGHLLVSSGRPDPDIGGFEPAPGDFHILPFPFPLPDGDARLQGITTLEGPISIDLTNAFGFGLAAVSGPADGWIL